VHVTATVYSHALPDDEIAAARIWNEAMSGTLKQAVAEPSDQTKPSRIVSIDAVKKPA
jgi:hypothetical protein